MLSKAGLVGNGIDSVQVGLVDCLKLELPSVVCAQGSCSAYRALRPWMDASIATVGRKSATGELVARAVLAGRGLGRG